MYAHFYADGFERKKLLRILIIHYVIRIKISDVDPDRLYLDPNHQTL